jgi:hypothetical protein
MSQGARSPRPHACRQLFQLRELLRQVRRLAVLRSVDELPRAAQQHLHRLFRARSCTGAPWAPCCRAWSRGLGKHGSHGARVTHFHEYECFVVVGGERHGVTATVTMSCLTPSPAGFSGRGGSSTASVAVAGGGAPAPAIYVVLGRAQWRRARAPVISPVDSDTGHVATEPSRASARLAWLPRQPWLPAPRPRGSSGQGSGLRTSRSRL